MSRIVRINDGNYKLQVTPNGTITFDAGTNGNTQIIMEGDTSINIKSPDIKLYSGGTTANISTSNDTVNLFNTATTINAFGSATSVNIGASNGTVTIAGSLMVNGNTTTINSTELTVDDKNIILADSSSPSDILADGGGITLRGSTDKLLTWVNSTNSWTSSENFDILLSKTYKIDGTDVLTSSEILPYSSIVDAFGSASEVNIGSTGTVRLNCDETIVTGDLTISGSNILSTSSTNNLLSTSDIVNAFDVASIVNIGGNDTDVYIPGRLHASGITVTGISDELINTSTSSLTQTVIDTFDKLTHRSAKYLIQMSSGINFHTCEISVLHDGTDINMVQYLDNIIGLSCGTFDTNMTGNNVELLFTPSILNINILIVKKVLIL